MSGASMNKLGSAKLALLLTFLLGAVCTNASAQDGASAGWNPPVKSIHIDARGNVLIELSAATLPAPVGSAAVRDCKGAQINREGYNCYTIERAQGDGTTLIDKTWVSDVQIFKASGDGLVVRGSHNAVNRAIIVSAAGTGLVVSGNNNSLDHVYIADCKTPIKVLGSNNFVSYAVGPKGNLHAKPLGAP